MPSLKDEEHRRQVREALGLLTKGRETFDDLLSKEEAELVDAIASLSTQRLQQALLYAVLQDSL